MLLLCGAALLAVSLGAAVEPDYHVVKEDGVAELGLEPMHPETVKYIEQRLKEKAVDNYRCRITNYTIKQDSPFSSPDKNAKDDSLNSTEVRWIIGRPETVQWAHINQYYFSDVSGRHSDPIVGTLGGDIGEFILSMAVYEDVMKTELTQEETVMRLQGLLSSLSRKKFYYGQTEEALKRLVPDESCTKFDIANPPEEAKQALLEKVAVPSNVGCTHLNTMLTNPGVFKTRKEVIEMGIKAFYLVMWNKTFEFNDKLSYMVVRNEPGMERALVNIETDQHCLDQGLVPLIQTHHDCATGNRTIFIMHNQAVDHFRLTLAHFWGEGNGPLTQKLETKMYVKGLLYLAKSAPSLMPKTSYPVYTVKFFFDGKMANKELTPHA